MTVHKYILRYNVSFHILEDCESQERGQLKTKKSYNGGKGTCIFPFNYKNSTYISCANPTEYGGVGWCAWDRDYQQDRWGYCSSSCPLSKKNLRPHYKESVHRIINIFPEGKFIFC